MQDRIGWIASRRRSLGLAGLAAVAALGIAGCKGQTAEERGREIREKILSDIVDVEAVALEQKVDPAVVTEVQRQLTAINEYQGEVDGKLDSVTINAIQAFQRAAQLPDNGILTQATRDKLAATAAGRGKS